MAAVAARTRMASERWAKCRLLALVRVCFPGEALVADAEDGEGAEVCLEADLVVEGGGQAVQVGVIERADVAAGAADQVVVVVDAYPLEFGVAGAHVGLADEAEVGCGVEGAVYRGGVDERVGATHLVKDAGGGDVASGMAQGRED